MTAERILYVVDDEAIVRASIVSLMHARGELECREYMSGDAFLADLDRLEPGCVVLDLQLERETGLAVMQALATRLDRFRMVVVTGLGDLAVAIEAFRAGAVDFLYKPYEIKPLLGAIDRAFHLLEQGADAPDLVAEARARLGRLGAVEARVLAGLIRGSTNQDIAMELGLDARAIQIHRARALAVLEAPSILAAIRTARIAGWPEDA